jgi:LPS-assembly protein
VQLFYQGRILQADRVIYDRANKRVFAEGHTKLTDEHGDVTYAKRFELTDNFRDGFIDSLQVLTSDKTRFSSPRAERANGDVTVLEKGTYTACEPCKDHPEKPPLWQVKAARIIEDQQSHVIYYEDAWLELGGIPVAYMPYFSSPDATVNKQSGFLAPSIVEGANLGSGISTPYFINLAPNYDITLIPTYYSIQGFFGEIDWRQRLATGSYTIRLTGIDQQDPGVFFPYPYGAGDRRLRGSAESAGEFYLNDKWKFGWDGTLLSDKFYADDYKIKGIDLTNYFFQDIVSSIYLRGQGEHSYFDLSEYQFVGTTAYDQQLTMPVATVLDYNRVFPIAPDRSDGVGGEATIDVNMTNIMRSNAAFQSIGVMTLDKAFNLYSVCEPNGVPNYTPGACLLKGIGGDYARASAQASWQRTFIDPYGEIWKPFIYARAVGESTDLNTTKGITYASALGASTVNNSYQPAFFNGLQSASDTLGMAGVGLEYRYPFFAAATWGQQTIEPIAQLIVRPNEVLPQLQPNEDAQSLVFDETNLFAWDKYSGYDRTEGGSRVNYGLQYTANFANGGHANVVGGESVQVAGQNSYTLADPTNTGLESGLDRQYSNFVAGETLAPTSGPLTFISKQQFDSTNMALVRFDAIASTTFKDFGGSVDYARYDAQPLIGFPFPREGVITSASYKFRDHWTVEGSLLLDMSRQFYDVPGQSSPRLDPTAYSFGLGYIDECTTLKINYSSTLSTPLAYAPVPGGPIFYNPAVRDQTVTVQLVLRTLGDVKADIGIP